MNIKLSNIINYLGNSVARFKSVSNPKCILNNSLRFVVEIIIHHIYKSAKSSKCGMCNRFALNI